MSPGKETVVAAAGRADGAVAALPEELAGEGCEVRQRAMEAFGRPAVERRGRHCERAEHAFA